MSGRRNPFSSGAGKRPPVLAGRDDVLAAVVGSSASVLARLANARGSAPVVIGAMTGLGKTVLLHELARHAVQTGWSPSVATVGRGGSLRREFVRGLAAAVLGSGNSVPIDDASRWQLRQVRAYGQRHGIFLPVGDAPADDDAARCETMADLLMAVGESARVAGRGRLVLVDDAHRAPDDERDELISAATVAGKAGQPLAVVVAGLPSITEGVDGSVIVHHLRRLIPSEVYDAVVPPAGDVGIDVTTPGLVAMGLRSGGYPCLLQPMARHLVAAAVSPVGIEEVAVAVAEVEELVRRNLYGPVVDALAARHLPVLRAIADLDAPPTVHEIAVYLDAPMGTRIAGDEGHDAVDDSPTVVRLITELESIDAVYRLDGRVHFALPFFDRVVKAIAPRPDRRPR